ncbi:MAG: hypothetical protein J6570_03275 [Snodgrassella sp.]|nr:hypothetical protein [Snodgrassella sp.]
MKQPDTKLGIFFSRSITTLSMLLLRLNKLRMLHIVEIHPQLKSKSPL